MTKMQKKKNVSNKVKWNGASPMVTMILFFEFQVGNFVGDLEQGNIVLLAAEIHCAGSTDNSIISKRN